MFHGMERGDLRTLYVIGENPAQSEADIHRARKLLSELDLLIVQDILFTKTAEMADIVFPSSASWCEAEGTVTNSERRVQRCRQSARPARRGQLDIWILAELAKRLGFDWGSPTAEDAWNELRSLSPMHAGMSYERLEELGGHPVAVPDGRPPGVAVSCTPGSGRSPGRGPRRRSVPWSSGRLSRRSTPTIRSG